jgi:hypothetical protein
MPTIALSSVISTKVNTTRQYIASVAPVRNLRPIG